MIISQKEFFSKSSECFFHFEHMLSDAIKNRQSFSFNVLDNGSIKLESHDMLDFIQIIGSSDFFSLNELKEFNIFYPFVLNLTNMRISSQDIYFYPRYSQSIADFFARNLETNLLANVSKFVYINKEDDISYEQIAVSRNFINKIVSKFELSFSKAFEGINDSLLKPYIIKTLFVSGIKLGNSFLDKQILDLNYIILAGYEKDIIEKTTSRLISSRNSLIKSKFN